MADLQAKKRAKAIPNASAQDRLEFDSDAQLQAIELSGLQLLHKPVRLEMLLALLQPPSNTMTRNGSACTTLA